MCYNGSMDRLNVLKGIEKILVEKAYEVGHISHRKGGDWQKQADGSWIPYRGGQSDQNKKDSAPTKNTGHGGAVKQDFESVPDSVKDKMFTIAQQYQSEWAEDSDEDVRSMAEGDVEDLAQKLWDGADEETRNSWLGDSDTSSADEEAGDIDDYIEWGEIDNDTMLEHAYDMMPKEVQDQYDINDVLKMWQEKRGLKEGQTDVNAKGKNKEKKRLTPTTLKELADESGMEVDKLREYLESNGVEIEEDVENSTPVQGTEWTGEPMSTEDVQYEVDRISKVDPSGTGWIIKNPTPAKLDKQAEKMTDSFMEYFSGEVGVDVDRADLKNRVLQKMNELNGVQKSAVRDMKSTPVIKNMGF